MARIPLRYLPDFVKENMKHGWDILKTELEALFLKTSVILSSHWIFLMLMKIDFVNNISNVKKNRL